MRRRGRPPKAERQPPRESLSSEPIAVRIEGVRTERHREAGAVHVGHQFWRRLELDGILKGIGLDERTRLLTCAMTLNRLIHPDSEHAMPDWMRSTALEDILGVRLGSLAEDSLYRNLDRLHPHRAAIESALAARERALFNLDDSILLYDLTSTYFEGLCLDNPAARRGYSRDSRPDCKQVVVGLVLNGEGFPQAHEIFRGNLNDRASLKPMLDRLDERIGLREGQTVVVDRGMAFEENLADIRGRRLHYIVAARQSERKQWLSEFDQLEGFTEVIRETSPNNRYQQKSRLLVKAVPSVGETHVLCVSSGRALKDRAIRETHEKRLLVDLAKLAKRVAKSKKPDADKINEAIGRLRERYPRVARYYLMVFDPLTGRFGYEVDEVRRGQAERLDGSYLLRTDRTDLTAHEIWRTYTLLTRVESAFRSMKSPLSERPIFHHLENRVETHIFLCVLALHLLISIERTLRDAGAYTSWETVRGELRTHQVCTVVLPTDRATVLRIRQGSTPEPKHLDLYRRLNVPSQVMRPIRTWSDAKDEPS